MKANFQLTKSVLIPVKYSFSVSKAENYSTFTSSEAQEDTNVAMNYDQRNSLDRHPPCQEFITVNVFNNFFSGESKPRSE